MKRNISAILICSLLLQLYGCYSFEEISVDDLSSRETELMLFTTDSIKYFLKNYSTAEEMIQNPGSYFSDKWLIKQDTITVFNSITYSNNKLLPNPFLKTDTTKISYELITKVMADRYDTGKTILLFVGLAVVFAVLASFIPSQEKTIEFPEIPNPFHY